MSRSLLGYDCDIDSRNRGPVCRYASPHGTDSKLRKGFSLNVAQTIYATLRSKTILFRIFKHKSKYTIWNQFSSEINI